MARWVGVLAGVGAGAGAAGALLAPELAGLERRAPWPVLLAARSVLAGGVGLAAGALAAVAPRARPAAVGAAAVAGLVLARRVVPAPSLPAPGPVRLSVLVANVWQGRADATALAAILRAERPDLVVLPEAGERFRARLAPGIADLGYRARTAPPPRAHRRVPRDPDGPWTTVLTAPSLGDVRVAPVAAGGLYGWLEVTGGALGGIRVLATHPVAPVRGLVRTWAAELDLLAAWRDLGGPTVVAGDLNTTVEHRALAALGDGRAPGRPPTWPAQWPRWLGFRIDHVLAGGGIAVRATRVLDLPGSDHRAVLAHLG